MVWSSMSEDRRYHPWERKPKKFYKDRDHYAESKTGIDLNAAIKFCRSCKRDYGFVPHPQHSKIDLESTFAGAAIAKLNGKEKEWQISNIKGKLVKKKNWWIISLENQSCFADTQNLYRFALLSQMTGNMTDELREDISEVLFKCYDNTKKAFSRKPNARYTLRHVLRQLWDLLRAIKLRQVLY